MANINVVVIEGNLVKAAELSRWSDGTPYIRFTIANNEFYKDSSEKYNSIPSFIDCQCKGPYAESMSKHLLKGRRISVFGRLKQQRWTDENGLKHSAIVVKVSEISLLPNGNNSNQNAGSTSFSEQSNQTNYAAENQNMYSEATEFYDSSMFDNTDPIPF